MERILVGLKRVVDYNVRVRVRSDGSGVETDGVKMSINPFDEIALEEALRIRERGETDEVVVVSIGGTESAELVILGKQAIDDDNNQTGQMLAALWGRPQATFASKVELEGSTAKVTREVDVGLETLEIDLPAVVTVDLRLNEPRYVKLPDIMKAKKKPLDHVAVDELGVEPAASITAIKFEPPEQRQKGIIVDDVAALVAALKDKGLV